MSTLHTDLGRLPAFLSSKIEIRDGHWRWIGAFTEQEYAQVRPPGKLPQLAHRVVWELLNGSLPNRLENTCGTRECVLPTHWVGAEHPQFAYRKKRAQTEFTYRGYHLRSKYGLTVRQFEQMLKNQKRRCACCRGPMTGKKEPAVDHDHLTGKVRALLCTRCNLTVGFFEDKKLVRNVAAYLSRFQ